MLFICCILFYAYLLLPFDYRNSVTMEVVKNLKCPTCFQSFENPKYLPCHHSYCEQCLEKMQVQSKIMCPECRKEAIVPAGGVKDLPNNFLINRMVDEQALKRKVESKEEMKCDECDEDEPVVAYCPECNSFLCQFCYETHKRSKRFRSHKLISLNKAVTQLSTWNNAKCIEHDEQLKYYCETCEQLLCMYCTVKEHNGHNHDTVKKMATKHRNELKEVTTPVDEMIRDLSEAHDNIDKIRQQGNEVDKKIDQHYDELVPAKANEAERATEATRTRCSVTEGESIESTTGRSGVCTSRSAEHEGAERCYREEFRPRSIVSKETSD